MGFEIGESVGDYRITGVLGAGGYGEVYRAEHTITKRLEALKVLTPGRSHTAEEEQRFRREIQLHASLAHPNIASVHNAFSTKLGLVLVMELVEGESLEAMLQRGRIPLEAGVDYILQVLSALGHAHANAVLHRDVKPANIVIAPDGSVKLTDFGLARQQAVKSLTQSGTPAGSPYYMSPEQIHGVGPVDARSDLYSTGAALYEVATGRKPFEGESAFEVMQAHVERAPVPPVEVAPGIGPALNRVVLTALAKDPAQRFQSAAEFSDALERARRELRLAHVKRGGPRRRGLRVLGSKMLWAAAVALALGAIILAGIARQPERQAPTPPAPVAAQPVPVEPPAAPPPEEPAAAAGTPAAEPPALPEEAEEAPAPKKVRRANVLAAPRREPPPVEQEPLRVVEPPPANLSEPAAVTAERRAASEEAAPVPAADAAPPQPEEPKAEAASEKRGNRLWRALKRIPRPWRSSKKPEGEASEAPPE